MGIDHGETLTFMNYGLWLMVMTQYYSQKQRFVRAWISVVVVIASVEVVAMVVIVEL